jgi:branched-chain amino acid transport system substrate-binding protein
MARFVHGFKERFGDEPEAVAGHGYDAIDILASVLATSGTDATRVKTALYSVRNFPGVTGTMTFDDHGDVLKSIDIKQIKQGNPILIDVVKP